MSGRVWRVLSEVYVLSKALFRYKELAFWVIIFPLMWYGLMVAIWGSPEPEPVDVAVVNMDVPVEGVSFGSILVEAMNESGLFNVEVYQSREALVEGIRNGTVNAGLFIPENLTHSILVEMEPGLVVVYTTRSEYGNYYGQLLLSFVDSFSTSLRERMAEEALSFINQSQGPWAEYAVRGIRLFVEPIRVQVEEYVPPLLATPGGVKAFYAISMVGVEALFIGLFSGVLSVIERKRTGTLRVLLSSPMTSMELLAADTLSALASVGVSTLVIVGVSLLTGAEYFVSPLSALTVALLLVAGTLFIIGLGLLLAPLAKTTEGATIIANAIAFPVMFVGGIVIPKFLLPSWLQAFAEAWPLSRAVEAVRKLLLYGATPGEALAYAAPAIVATVAVYAAGAVVYKRLMARTIEYP